MAYVLRLEAEQHASLENSATFSTSVPAAGRKRRETVLILASEAFTHIATGEIVRGRMHLTEIYSISRPVQWLEMPAIIPHRLIVHAQRVFESGGRLPAKTGTAILEALVHLRPDVGPRVIELDPRSNSSD